MYLIHFTFYYLLEHNILIDVTSKIDILLFDEQIIIYRAKRNIFIVVFFFFYTLN